MRKTIFITVLFAAFSFAFYIPFEKKSVQVDVAKSSLVWTGYKVLGKHYGNINLKSGKLDVDGNMILGGSFVIDMTSIDCSDLSGGTKDKLVGHLKSDDFFSVEKFNTAELNILKAERKSTGKYNITADLTIKGITHQITFPATFSVSGNETKAEASIKVDRTLYNVRYGSGKFFDGLGDNMIKDNFDLEVVLVINEKLAI